LKGQLSGATKWIGDPTATLNSTINIKGKPFQVKGIDLLNIDCPTKKIKNYYTSWDWLNYLNQIGYTLGGDACKTG